MPKVINNKDLKKALASIDVELSNIKLMKDYGYFYLSSDDELWSNRIGDFYFNSILINSFKDNSIDEWVSEIIDVLTQERFDVYRDKEDWQIDLRRKFEKSMK